MTSYWEVQCELAYPENTILVNAFLLSEKATRSNEFSQTHVSILQRFFLTQTKHFADITEKEIRQWLTEQEKTLTEKTRGQYLSYIRQLYNYAVLEKHMEESPLYPKKNGLKAYWLLDMEWVVPENAERVAGFLLHQKGRNICKSTILRQRSILQRFFVHQTKDLTDIMKEDIEQWIAEQKIHHNIVAVDFFKILNIFLNYAVLEQYIEISPLHAKDKPVTSHEKYYELK